MSRKQAILATLDNARDWLKNGLSPRRVQYAAILIRDAREEMARAPASSRRRWRCGK